MLLLQLLVYIKLELSTHAIGQLKKKPNRKFQVFTREFIYQISRGKLGFGIS